MSHSGCTGARSKYTDVYRKSECMDNRGLHLYISRKIIAVTEL